MSGRIEGEGILIVITKKLSCTFDNVGGRVQPTVWKKREEYCCHAPHVRIHSKYFDKGNFNTFSFLLCFRLTTCLHSF